MEDPIHLRKNGKATSIIAETIMKEIEKLHVDTPQLTVTITQERPTSQQQSTKKTEVDEKMVGLVVGSGGKTLKRLADDNNVVIDKYPNRNNSNVIFEVKGRPDNVERTIWAIERIASANDRKEREKRSRSPGHTTCKFYLRDICRNGQHCKFLHQKPSKTKNRSRSRSPIDRKGKSH